MSNNNNGSFNFDKFNFNKQQQSSDSKPTTLTMANNNNNANNDEFNLNSSTTSMIKPPPYSSIKKLNLFTKRRQNIDDDNSLFSDSSVSSKRFRINDDSSESQLPLSLRRRHHNTNNNNTSCLSTPSTSPGPGSFKSSDFRYLHAGRLSTTSGGRDSPSSCFRQLNLHSRNNNSYFYSGRTTFGGANLRRPDFRHLSTTPYSKFNVKCLEAKPRSSLNNSRNSLFNDDDAQQSDLPLSSVTQRILDRLEKAATPITTDAKLRIGSLIKNQKFDLSTTSSSIKETKSKLFDTSIPSLENRNRFQISNEHHKPLKYILQPSINDDGDNDDSNNKQKEDETIQETGDKSIDDDLRKLEEIRKAEKELLLKIQQADRNKQQQQSFISRKDVQIGKITSRDVKKGRRNFDSVGGGEENEDDDLKSLAKVQPLTITTELKPITFKFSSSASQQQQNLEKTSDNLDLVNKKPFETCDNNNFTIPSNVSTNGGNSNRSSVGTESIFKFSTPKLVAQLSRDVSPITDRIKFSSPLSVSSSRSVSTGDLSSLQQQQEEENKSSETDSNSNKNSNTSLTSSTSLFDIFKNKIQSNNKKLWPCPTCCTENDSDVEKCIACEESNPNVIKKSQDNDSSSLSKIKFGSFPSQQSQSSSINTNTTPLSSSSLTPLSQLFKKNDPGKTWTCPTCSVSNNQDQMNCVSCEEPNPNNQKKSDNQSSSTTTTTTSSLFNTTGFKFGAFNSTKTDETIKSDSITKPSLSELFKSNNNTNIGGNNDKLKWICPTCMVKNDSDDAKCVSCEEPNPNNSNNNKNNESSINKSVFKFGSFGSGDNNKNDQKQEQKIENKTTKLEDGWKCFYCQTINEDQLKNVCKECKKIKVMAATKDQLQKFYQSQTFKFGSSSSNNNQNNENNQKSATVSDQSDKKLESNQTSVPKLDDIKTNETKSSLFGSDNKTQPQQQQSLFPKFNTTDSNFKIDFKFGDKSTTSTSSSMLPTVSTGFSQSSSFKFGQTSQTSDGLKSDTTNVSTNLPSLFQFGSTASTIVTNKTSLETQPPSSSIDSSSSLKSMLEKPKSTTDNVDSGNNDDSNKKIATEQQQQQSSTAPVAGNLLIFGSKSSTLSTTPATTSSLSSSNETNNNDNKLMAQPAPPVFGFNQPASTVVSSTTMETPNLFKITAPLSSTKTESDDNKVKSNDITGLGVGGGGLSSGFQFPSTKVSSLTTSSSLFSFGGQPSATLGSLSSSTSSSATAAATVSSSSTSNASPFGKPLDFGSPINIPKIDPGPPISNSVININFSQQPSSSSTSTTGQKTISLFDFSANKSTLKPSTTFNFGNSSSLTGGLNNTNPSTNSAVPAPTVFGTPTVPTSFNFMANNTNNNNQSNSLFSFGATSNKPNDPVKPLQDNTTSTGFNFTATPFGSLNNPLIQQQQQPQQPGLMGLPAQSTPSPFNPSLIGQPPGGLPTSSMFQFQSFPTNPNDAQANRKIKKARRRLPGNK